MMSVEFDNSVVLCIEIRPDRTQCLLAMQIYSRRQSVLALAVVQSKKKPKNTNPKSISVNIKIRGAE